MMSTNRFFRGFFAALREHDLTFVNTRGEAHHARFAVAVDVLREAQDAGHREAREMPLALVADPFTGRFNELDDALVRMQQGLLGAQNPFYPGIWLTLTKERAESILSSYDQTERALLESLAAAFVAEEATDAPDAQSA